MAKKFDIDAGREPKKDFFGTSVTTVVEEKLKKKSSNDRVSIYLDRHRRDLVKGYVKWKRENGFPFFNVKDFYSEAVDKMEKENPSVQPYEGKMI